MCALAIQVLAIKMRQVVNLGGKGVLTLRTIPPVGGVP